MGREKALPIKRAKKHPMWKTPEQIRREMADVANPKWDKEVERAGNPQTQIVEDDKGKKIKVHTAMSQFIVNQAKTNGPPVFKFQAKEVAEKATNLHEADNKNTSKGKENEKMELIMQQGPTATSKQHRQIIKSIRARNRKDLKNNSSVGGTFNTPSEQALKEPNFIGKNEDVFYFILNERSYYEKLIPGEYAIIYTRPVGENFGSTSKSALIDPNMTGGNTIEVFRDIDQAREHGSEPLVAFIGQLMHDHQNEKEPYTCAGQIKSGGRLTHFAFRAPAEAQVKPYKAAVDLHTYPMNLDEKHAHSPLDAKFHDTIRLNGTTVSFGYKEMCSEENILRDCWRSSGFQFIEMEIATFCEGKNERQLIIGAKLPNARDLSSAFILKQIVPYNTHLHNIAMMYQEEMDLVWQGSKVHESEDRSDGEFEGDNKKKTTSRGILRLPPFSALGLSNVNLDMFNASTFETYILHQDLTIHALETILAFMNKWLQDAFDSRGRNGLREARDYTKHRLMVSKHEYALMHAFQIPVDEDAMDIDVENVPGVNSCGSASAGKDGGRSSSFIIKRRTDHHAGMPMP